MKECIVLLVWLGLTTGCSLSDIGIKGAEINDTAVDTAVFTLCWGASIGSIRREFGDNPETWKALCANEDGLEIPGEDQL